MDWVFYEAVVRDFACDGQNLMFQRLIRSFPVIFAATLLTQPGTATAQSEANAGNQPVGLKAFSPDDAGFTRSVAPFLQKHCYRCHGGEKQEADFRIDTQLTADLSHRGNRQRWAEVVDVLNSHSMPPEEESQPDVAETATIVDWATEQTRRAELVSRSTLTVLRRMNRVEYRNTIRDLVGIDFDTSGFPQDPPAGGFDNNGSALTMSPLLIELYYEAARKIVDRAIVTSKKPASIRWRFEPETGDSDNNRVEYAEHRVIVNGGKNRAEDGFRIIHHNSWDKTINARDFALPEVGEYIIRVRAAGTVPTRAQVVESARVALQDRLDQQMKEKPDGATWHRQQFERDLQHFQTHRIYDYGPPRARLTLTLGGQPRVIGEFDVEASPADPQVTEIQVRCTTEKAGVTVDYAYSIPRELENFWFQSHDKFARPELYVDWVEIEGPVNPVWPPKSHTKLLGDVAPLTNRGSHEDDAVRAEEIIRRFMKLAFRRPVTIAEVDEKMALFESAQQQNDVFEEAIRIPLISILVSPSFLYLTEPETHEFAAENETSAPPVRLLTPHQLAARLSYFLWSTMPDEELTALADSGAILDENQLTQHIDRMLADARSEAFVKNFAGQWLGLRDVGANPPAEDLYPQYDRHLETSIVAESESFFRELLRNDLDVMNFVKSDFVVINERLARFYGIDGVKGDAFRRVTVPDGVMRGGILTQASILTTTSNGTRTSPVKRGTWILKNILGMDPGLPVANAGEIAPKVPGIDKATVRQRLEIHRTLPQCARCHHRIDPLGFALENFNACGEYREREGHGYKGRIEQNDPVIDTSSQLPDGTEIAGLRDLQNSLLERDDAFLNCLAGKIMTYALGREPGLADNPEITAIVAKVNQNNGTLRAMLTAVVLSETFRSR